jgi:hypothetical protein
VSGATSTTPVAHDARADSGSTPIADYRLLADCPLPATDQRMRWTIEAIARELTKDGLVLRYRNEAPSLAQAGEVERAEALFDRLAGYANDLGLLAGGIDKAREERG